MNIKNEIKKLLQSAGVEGDIKITTPPRSEMGDLSFAVFGTTAHQGLRQIGELVGKMNKIKNDNGFNFIDKIAQAGHYINFFLNPKTLAKNVLSAVDKKDFGRSKSGKGQKIMVEFAHPNTHKAFHIGHLRNITTGESMSRIFENAGYKVVRANYQGDVGLHIAKCMWGIARTMDEYEATKKKSAEEKAKFLGRVYALGGQAYEKDEQTKKEIVDLNEKIYAGGDKELNKIYKETRQWSLDYFEIIYKRVGTHFDRLYFESEVFERGIGIVEDCVKKGILEASQGAVIFAGEKYGLHNRVFLNSKGLPTYEAKDLALAELQLKEYNPKVIFHLVAKEQTEYFRVVFKALEFVLPKSKGREEHLVYGWVSLKEGKMSSRTGNVVLGEWLLDEVKNKIRELVKDHEIKDAEEVTEKVAMAAVKYSFLRTGATNDIAFDINESVSLTGDSGPYLLYIVARIKSIFRKYGQRLGKLAIPEVIEPAEKNLLNQIVEFEEVAARAAKEHDPSKIAHYLLDLAQSFNNFYNLCPVLKSEGVALSFRLHLIKAVEQAMTKGLYLLGIETVEEM